MARKKQREFSRQERRRLHTQQILFAILAVLVIASFVISLVTR